MYKTTEKTPLIPTGKWIVNNLTSGHVPYSYAKSEITELIDEIKHRSWSGIKDETSDVIASYAAALYSNHGINLPALGSHASSEKYRQRLLVWDKIFQDRGLTFHPKYLVNGGNYAKPEKVEAAINEAKRQLSVKQLFSK